MIMSYHDIIMATRPIARNQVKNCRQQRNWSQAELARHAGISRSEVSAIEVSGLVPSVVAALSLSRALGRTVEELFGSRAGDGTSPKWAWPPTHTPCRYWQATVQGAELRFPAEALPAGVLAHDGIFQSGRFAPREDADPRTTLVLASCDPAVALLAAEYARATGFRMVPLARSSRQALALLGQGLVHVAGVHFSTREEPDGNLRSVQEVLGSGYSLVRVAGWQEGLAFGYGSRISSVSGAMRAKLRWIGREPGSAARQCLDALLPNHPPPRRIAHNHQAVVEAVRCGWAEVGVCHRLVSEEAGLRFVPVREENFDLCYSAVEEGDPRIAGLLRVIRSSSYRRLVGELPGYDTAQAGELSQTV